MRRFSSPPQPQAARVPRADGLGEGELFQCHRAMCPRAPGELVACLASTEVQSYVHGHVHVHEGWLGCCGSCLRASGYYSTAFFLTRARIPASALSVPAAQLAGGNAVSHKQNLSGHYYYLEHIDCMTSLQEVSCCAIRIALSFVQQSKTSQPRQAAGTQYDVRQSNARCLSSIAFIPF